MKSNSDNNRFLCLCYAQHSGCVNPELFLVGILNKSIVATCMAGYEGHIGWINYLAVSPQYRRQGIAYIMFSNHPEFTSLLFTAITEIDS